ncbi:MAG: hypothetical protein ACI8XC_004023 [Gammaproteobacteria bacterium]|jgi:hypothetical protein
MFVNEETKSIQKTAKVAGWLYLLLIPLGILGIIYVPEVVVVAGDVATTINNIMADEALFRLSIVAALVLQVVNIFVVLYLYKLLKPVSNALATLMVIFILVAVPVAMVNELFNAAILMLLGSPDYLFTFTTVQLHALVQVLLDLHEAGIFVAHVFWGLWLFPMGYLVFKSGFLPKTLGVLLMIACVGYLLDSIIYFVFPGFGVVVSEYTFIGEVLLPLWLVTKGVKVEQWESLPINQGI